MTRLIFSLLMLILISLPAFSQSGLKVKDVIGTLTPKSGFEPTKIAVDDVRYAGIDFISRQDSIIMRNCGVILRNDLDFSPLFEGLGVDSFFMKHMELESMSISSWKWLGARYVVKLEVEYPRNEIQVRYRLYSVDAERELTKGNYKITKANYRSVVHRIANEIIKFLTGDKGIYETSLIYCKKVESAQELFMSDFDGHNERQLSFSGSLNILPSISPDGKFVYFTGYRDGRPKLYMLTLESGIIDLLTEYSGLNAAAAVSPDGKSIACVLSKDGNSEIYLLERNGKIKKRLTNSWAIETSPSWSPDGKMMAFTSDRTGSPQIYIMDAEGLNVRRLTYQGKYNESPCWSPKGDILIFVTRDKGFKICSIDVTGKNFKILTEYGDSEDPYVSPDGNHIVFSSNRLGTKELYIMDIFGGNKQKISEGGIYASPVWMPIK